MATDEISLFERPTTRKTKEPPVNILLVQWLQRCAETFPMYGKTLADYPGRFELFRDALAGLTDAAIDYGFKQALKYLTEFPVPAQVLEYAESMPAPVESQRNYNRMVEAYKARHRSEAQAPHGSLQDGETFERALERVSATKAMDAPGKTLHEQQQAAALARLGGSTMPAPIRSTVVGENPAVRPDMWEANREWHERMAVKNGWKDSRQPGEDE